MEQELKNLKIKMAILGAITFLMMVAFILLAVGVWYYINYEFDGYIEIPV